MNADVYLVSTKPKYPDVSELKSENPLISDINRALTAMGLDPNNPFKDWLCPGNTAVIKPNWVANKNTGDRENESMITNHSLIYYAAKWCAAAMAGKGTVVIGDAPMQDCDFKKLIKQSRVDESIQIIKEDNPGLNILIEDWRLTTFQYGCMSSLQHSSRADDKQINNRYQLIDAGEKSFLEDISEYSKRFRVTCYDPRTIPSHHHPGKHEYLVTKRAFEADLLINLPKIKTHRKAGLTGALKNIVGINGHKEYLPHHIRGGYHEGGDRGWHSNVIIKWYEEMLDYYWKNFKSFSGFQKSIYGKTLNLLKNWFLMNYKDDTTEGSWSGNETIWRTILDLNHMLYFGVNSPGRIINIADGVIAGEGEGPLNCRPKPLGLIMFGENPAYIDATIAMIMGYNISRIPAVYNAIYDRRSGFEGPSLGSFHVNYVSGNHRTQLIELDKLQKNRFIKPMCWKHAESAE